MTKKITRFTKWIVVAILIVLPFYLLLAFIFINSAKSILQYQEKSLKTYISNHSKELDKIVFTQSFEEAKKCQSLAIPIEKESCEKNVATIFNGMILKHTEEEKEFQYILASYNWPYDLMFVKQEGDNFFKLNWSGKFENITSLVNKDSVNDKTTSLFIKFLTHKCNFFGVANKEWAYEVFSPVNLSSNGKGYLLTIHGLTGEDEFVRNVFYPVIQVLRFLKI